MSWMSGLLDLSDTAYPDFRMIRRTARSIVRLPKPRVVTVALHFARTRSQNGFHCTSFPGMPRSFSALSIAANIELLGEARLGSALPASVASPLLDDESEDAEGVS